MQTEGSTRDRLVWHPLRNEAMGILDSISNVVAQLESKCPRMLTNLRRGPHLIMASDYSGESRHSAGRVYSFLLADAVYLWLWDKMRRQFRKKHLPNARRMSYKNLNDKHRQAALIPFLRIANSIPGLLLTFVVDKDIRNLFGATVDMAIRSGFIPPEWKPRTAERMLRIAALGGLMIACMSAPGQNILWFTDEDEIAANWGRVCEATKILGRLVENLIFHHLGHVRFGTAECDNGSRDVEDLLALPDLVSGALSDMSVLVLGPEKTGSQFYHTESPEKAAVVMNWIADRSEHTLKKLVVCITRSGEKLVTRSINFTALVRRSEFFWHEDARAVFRGIENA